MSDNIFDVEPTAETPTSAWTLDEDHRKLVESLNSEANRKEVVKVIRDSLDGHVQTIVEQYTDYLNDEYVLVLEGIANDRAKRLVNELLKGNREVAEYFNLVSETDINGNEVSYDFEGARRAIFDTFKADIVNAELITLHKDNDFLTKLNKSLVDMQSARY